MKKTKKTIGIYKITNPLGQVYVGQSIDIESRFLYYKSLKCKTQKKIYYSLLKHGVENHKFEIIQICPKCKLDEFEKFYIKKFECCSVGLNSTIGGYGVRKEFISYDEAKIWLQDNILNDGIITDGKKWKFFTDMIPNFIPKNPKSHYQNKGWISWDDFLQPKCIPYDEAKKWLKKNMGYLRLNPKNWKDKVHNFPVFIPKDPKSYYSNTNEWNSWEDFLGKKRKNKFISYDEAKKWIKRNISHLGIIKTSGKWRIHSYTMIPHFIPKNPHIWYKDKGWINWDDFLDLHN